MHTLWQHHLDTAPPPPAGTPAPVARVVLAAVAKDPAARPPPARAFAFALAAPARHAYGPGWTARSGIVLRLDDEVRDAAGDNLATALPASPALPVPPAPPGAGSGGAVPPTGMTMA